ncbi:bifunctional diguanylate cyclase/phosphodiesterase [Undibacterium sp. Ren11W]|uniref:bifunctional diguanylate cyclase/phosphodiesterase n=1 Tax=Undibacterium sp. Ren11W TaxID=3413045 RepID=UPI003BF30A87
MSMYRQLWIAIILSTLLASIGSLLASTLNSRAYLNEQLRMKNADNATVLALSLSQKEIDIVELELVIAALFDSGHYSSIIVRDANDKEIITRVAALEKTKVPAWFIQSFPILSTPGQAQISSGWKQLGTVSLVTQSSFAYLTLWQSTKEMIATLALSGLISGYLGTLILRRLRKPLSAVIAQANAMSERRFIIAPESKVPELRQLSTAMNSTVSLLKSMFAEEAERLEALRRQANTDLVSGLANRSHFMAQLHVMVEAEDAPAGSLMMLRLSHLAEINKQLGRNKVDTILKKFGTVLNAQASALPEGFAARMNGTDFALLFRQTEAGSVAASVFEAITQELAEIPNNPVTAFIGYGQFEFGIAPGALLSQVDEALASAEIGGVNAVRKAAPLNIEQAPRSSEEWSKLIERALEQQWVKLAFFPVVDFSQTPLHTESALRLMFGGEWFPAGRFLPIAERLGLTDKLDLAAINLGLNELSRNSQMDDIAINLSAQSIQNPAFREQLRALLLSRPAVSKRLWLEIPENGVFANLDAFRAFHRDVSVSGCKLGLEHFGRQFDKINLLHDLKLDYVKVDAGFIRGIDMNTGNQAFVKGIGSIVHRMGLQVFAEGVSSSAELASLSELGVDGVTGPIIGQSTDSN